MVLCMRSFRTQWGTSRAPERREGINQAISPAPWSGLRGINLQRAGIRMETLMGILRTQCTPPLKHQEQHHGPQSGSPEDTPGWH